MRIGDDDGLRQPLDGAAIDALAKQIDKSVNASRKEEEQKRAAEEESRNNTANKSAVEALEKKIKDQGPPPKATPVPTPQMTEAPSPAEIGGDEHGSEDATTTTGGDSSAKSETVVKTVSKEVEVSTTEPSTTETTSTTKGAATSTTTDVGVVKIVPLPVPVARDEPVLESEVIVPAGLAVPGAPCGSSGKLAALQAQNAMLRQQVAMKQRQEAEAAAAQQAQAAEPTGDPVADATPAEREAARREAKLLIAEAAKVSQAPCAPAPCPVSAEKIACAMEPLVQEVNKECEKAKAVKEIVLRAEDSQKKEMLLQDDQMAMQVAMARAVEAARKEMQLRALTNDADVLLKAADAQPAAPCGAPEPCAGAATGASVGPATPPLPAGWEISMDQLTGKPFYLNRATKQSQFEFPR